MPLTNPSYVFGADIKPARIVRMAVAGDGLPGNIDHTIMPATNGEKGIGVTHNGSREPPIPGIDEPLAGKAGESFWTHGMGAQCEILAGGAIAAGDYLGPATVDMTSVGLTAAEAGVAVAVSGAGAKYCARARAAAVLGEKVQVQVVEGELVA